MPDTALFDNAAMNKVQFRSFRNLIRVTDKLKDCYSVSIAILMLNIGAEVAHNIDILTSSGKQGRCPRWGVGSLRVEG